MKFLLLNRHRAVLESNQLLTIPVRRLSPHLKVACFQFRHSGVELPGFILLTCQELFNRSMALSISQPTGNGVLQDMRIHIFGIQEPMMILNLYWRKPISC